MDQKVRAWIPFGTHERGPAVPSKPSQIATAALDADIEIRPVGRSTLTGRAEPR